MSHISGLVAGNAVPSPFLSADIVSSTTHKTLRGPRAGVIFYRKAPRISPVPSPVPPYITSDEFVARINNAVFPSLQGGPHENAIAGIATMALESNTAAFRAYSHQVLNNAQALSRSLLSRGIRLVTGGTDVHFVLVDLARSPGKPGLERGDGARVQLAADLCGIVLNKNTVLGDQSAQQPSGLRIGTPALTSRGLNECDFERVAAFIDELLEITEFAKRVSHNLKTFRIALLKDPTVVERLNSLRERVHQFASGFPMPGLDEL